MTEIGIMQGRLSLPSDDKIQSFPKKTWQEEFVKAKQSALSHIEWIFEADEWEKNPISSQIGVAEINEAIRNTGVNVHALCADYFMDVPYFPSSLNVRKELQERLAWLLQRAVQIGVKYIDIPFVDASKIPSREEFGLVRQLIAPALPLAQKLDVTLTLETSLDPQDFRQLLKFLNHPNVNANYDTGNSAGIGYDCAKELHAYGEWIRTLHIKDRLLNNGTKPLGSGSVDFSTFFKSLCRLKFSGPIILQAAREEDGKEVETAVKNRKFVERYLAEFRMQ